MIIKQKIHAQGLTDVGKKRKNNEDAFRICDKTNTLVLADGMGGHAHGDIASNFLVDKFPEILNEQKEAVHSRSIKKAINLANEALFELQRANSSDMGATLVGLWFPINNPYEPYIFNVGDSRVYVYDPDAENISQITTDQGIAHRLFQAMGAEVTHPEIRQIKIKPNDVLLVCSDGLTDLVNDKDIAEILHNTTIDNLNEINRKLSIRANNHGGRDNITTIIAKVT